MATEQDDQAVVRAAAGLDDKPNLPPGVPDLPHYRALFATVEAVLDLHKKDHDGDVPGKVQDVNVFRGATSADGTTVYTVLPAKPKPSTIEVRHIWLGGPADETAEAQGLPLEVLLAVCIDKLRLVARRSHNAEFCENAVAHVKNALAAMHALSRLEEIAEELKKPSKEK